MIKEIIDDYDLREGKNTKRVIDLQSAKTQNVGEATSWWAANWWIFVVGGVAVFGFGTPGGRKIFSSVLSSASKLASPA